MHRALKAGVVPALAALAVALSAGAAPAQTGDADLSVTMAVVGHGKPTAKVGQFVQETVTVTNNGPGTAVNPEIGPLASDHFNTIEVTCTEGPGRIDCPASLAPGQTMTGEIVLQVCCLPAGDSRRGFVGVFAGSLTPDPNQDNNFATTVVKIIGSHGFVG